ARPGWVCGGVTERDAACLCTCQESLRRRSDVDTWVWIVIIVAAVVIVAAALGAFALSTRQKRRDEQLRSEFGPEYDRTMKQMGNRKKAEKALLGRKERVDQFHLKAISQADRERFLS